MENEREAAFLALVADALEVDSISGGDDYRSFPMWGSMAAFALKIMIERDFGKDLTLRELDSFATAGALMERVFA